MNNQDQTPHAASSIAPLHAVLVPGWWLGAWAWEALAEDLSQAGIVPHAVTLPGLDGRSTAGITFDDHVRAVVELLDVLDGDIALVGHSGGGAVVHAAADRNPGRIRRVVHVDTGPPVDGAVLCPGALRDLPFPTDEELVEQLLSTEGLPSEAIARLRERSVPHPVGVVTSPIRLGNPGRFQIPTTVVCCSMPSEAIQQMLADGELTSDLTSTAAVRYVDLPTGHWPMLSRPRDLAALVVRELLCDDPAGIVRTSLEHHGE